MRSLCTIFVFSVFIGSVSSPVLGADLTDNQMKMFCKLVDPTFLNRLPVIMEIKAAGDTQWGATLKYARDGAGGQDIILRFRAIYESNATTVDEAIKAIEQSCIQRLQENNG